MIDNPPYSIDEYSNRMLLRSAMAVVTAAITIERLAPAGERMAQIIRVIVIGAGLLLMSRPGKDDTRNGSLDGREPGSTR